MATTFRLRDPDFFLSPSFWLGFGWLVPFDVRYVVLLTTACAFAAIVLFMEVYEGWMPASHLFRLLRRGLDGVLYAFALSTAAHRTPPRYLTRVPRGGRDPECRRSRRRSLARALAVPVLLTACRDPREWFSLLLVRTSGAERPRRARHRGSPVGLRLAAGADPFAAPGVHAGAPNGRAHQPRARARTRSFAALQEFEGSLAHCSQP
jgi:hypothetical protein